MDCLPPMTDAMRAVALTAETMCANASKRWWQRQEPTPFEFVPVARQVVGALISAGYIDRTTLDRTIPDDG